MYEALYRKYRPRDFNEVVGQEHITETLKMQVRTARLSHAYLFIGTRGTGKTTCARILAKAVNCERPVDGNPCNECESCRAFDEGTLLDVTELDAASNNGVDDVRMLRDEAVFSPTRAKKRVYIIDEVHMLSKPAFNALLKILEEPPEHLMFILATTELNKVLPTILSRCQRHSFRRLDTETIAGRLKYVAQQEKIALTDDAAELLGRLADGGMRDGLSLLDQCASREVVDLDAVLSAMGLAGSYATAELADMVARHDAQSALLRFRQLWQEGKDPASLLGELANLYRDALMLRLAPKGGSSLLSGLYASDVLREVKLGSGELLEMLNVVQKYQSGMKDAPNVRLQCELCLIELCGLTPAESVRVEYIPTDAAYVPAPRFDAAAEKPAPAEKKSAPPIPEEPEPPAEEFPNPPKEDDDLPWEEEEPYVAEPDEPVWEDEPWDELPPIPEAPPWEDEPQTEYAPAPAEESAPAPASAERESWHSLLPRLKDVLDVGTYMFLTDESAIRAEWVREELVIRAMPGFYYTALNHPDILEAIGQEAHAHVRLEELDTAAESGGSSLDDLSRFSNVTFR